MIFTNQTSEWDQMVPPCLNIFKKFDQWPFPNPLPQRLDGDEFFFLHTEPGTLGFVVQDVVCSDYLSRIQITHINPTIHRGNVEIRHGDYIVGVGEDGLRLEGTNGWREDALEPLRTEARPLKVTLFRPAEHTYEVKEFMIFFDYF